MAALEASAGSEPLSEAASTHSRGTSGIASQRSTRLSPSEVESLRQEAERFSAWAKEELAKERLAMRPMGLAQPSASTPSDDGAAGP